MSLIAISFISLFKLNELFPNSELLYDITVEIEDVIFNSTGLVFDFNSDGYDDYHCGMR